MSAAGPRGEPIRVGWSKNERIHLMAYLLTHFWPGGTEDQYNATIAVVHPPGGLPEGQTSHAAGPTDGGILIAAAFHANRHLQRVRSRGYSLSVATAAKTVEQTAREAKDASHQLARASRDE